VQGLTKRFGDALAVDQLDFEIDPGTVAGFLGPNGAGKTTTLRMLLGLVTPDSGAATIAGRPYRELAEPVRRVGAVVEASGFHPGRSARDHLRTLATAAGLAPERVDQVLGQTGLAGAARRRVGGFSHGMRQRLGLAAALLGDPEVLILDEPANGLDPEGVHWLRGLAIALVAAAVVLAIAVPWLPAKGVHASLADPGLGARVAGLAAAVALWAVLGTGLGSLLRNQLAAVIVGVLWWQGGVEELVVGGAAAARP
jgi:ABC-2 type transport system ATP-binding protein